MIFQKYLSSRGPFFEEQSFSFFNLAKGFEFRGVSDGYKETLTEKKNLTLCLVVETIRKYQRISAEYYASMYS